MYNKDFSYNEKMKINKYYTCYYYITSANVIDIL